MTILTCDYNGHKEIYTADGKITPPLALYAQNALKPF